MFTRFFTCFTLGLSLLFGSPLVHAQESANYEKQSRKEFIQDFKNGILLVRLQDRDKSIRDLEERGLTKEADKIRQAQRRENREIMLSFGKTFDFCPVYFFYAKDSEVIRKGDYQGKVFDANLELLELPAGKKIFTAEFAETETLGIDGFIVMDDRLLPLEDPLPYFERRYVFFGLISRSKAKMVEAYNKKLQEYAKMYGLS